MLSTVRKHDVSSRAVEEIGVVSASAQGQWTVCAGAVEWVARRALSCLVAPEVDDQVLLAVAEDGRAWILAVLERRDGAAIHLEADGDLGVRLRNGRFSVAAQQGLDLATAQEASILAGTLKVTSAQATVHLDQLSYLGRLIHGNVDRIKLFANSLDTSLDRLWQRVKRSFRVVEELDHLQANEILYKAKNNAQIHGRNAMVSAEQIVKVDAGQIHIG